MFASSLCQGRIPGRDERDDAIDDWLTIGEVAARSGVKPSALRFYESRRLITSERTAGNQRRFHRSVLRRVAFIRAAQALGPSLEEIGEGLSSLPDGRTPTKTDWARLSRGWQMRLDEKIAELQQLRDELTECIGCGCLSLRACALFNPEDEAGGRGPGARYLLGDEPVV
ncbi:MAG: redox-sensitive transcriptional activator SoxR [Acidimicrobiia bacterium]